MTIIRWPFLLFGSHDESNTYKQFFDSIHKNRSIIIKKIFYHQPNQIFTSIKTEFNKKIEKKIRKFGLTLPHSERWQHFHIQKTPFPENSALIRSEINHCTRKKRTSRIHFFYINDSKLFSRARRPRCNVRECIGCTTHEKKPRTLTITHARRGRIIIGGV